MGVLKGLQTRRLIGMVKAINNGFTLRDTLQPSAYIHKLPHNGGQQP